MRVSELIAILKKTDPNAEVVIKDFSETVVVQTVCPGKLKRTDRGREFEHGGIPKTEDGEIEAIRLAGKL